MCIHIDYENMSSRLLPETVLFKNLDDSCNKAGDLMKLWKNRLTLQGLSISKRYLEGNLEILADFDFICNGSITQYCAIFYPMRMSALQCEKDLVTRKWGRRRKRSVRNIDAVKNGNKQLMFVNDIEIVNGSEHISEPVFIWLQRANYINDLWGGTVYVSLSNSILKVIPVQTKRKVNAFRALLVKPNQITGEDVQSGSEVMNCIAKDSWEMYRDLFSDPDGPRTLSTIRAVLNNDSIRIMAQEFGNFRIKFRDVALGPLNF
jgi:hypothetical protein